jgi:peptidoglycan/LPS O-acetylase OafA/YrhL
MTYKLSYEANDVIKTFMKYESLTQYFYAVMIFIFVKELTIKIKNIKLINIIRYVGNYTFSIYLLHWFFTTYMTRVLGINRTIIGYRVGGAFVVYFGCIILIFILRKVPFMKRFLP